MRVTGTPLISVKKREATSPLENKPAELDSSDISGIVNMDVNVDHSESVVPDIGVHTVLPEMKLSEVNIVTIAEALIETFKDLLDSMITTKVNGVVTMFKER